MRAYINRPWISSFDFRKAPFSDKTLDQLHKLTRNFVASLSLGCPSAKHVSTSQRATADGKQDVRAEYKAWVKDWKIVYKEISQLIRDLKSYRRTVRFPVLTKAQQEIYMACNAQVNLSTRQHLKGLTERHLERLRETAQVMLNARYNAKLAAAERYRREQDRVEVRDLESLRQLADEAVA